MSVASYSSPGRRLLLASDSSDQSRELADILVTVGDVEIVPTTRIPEAPPRDLSSSM